MKYITEKPIDYSVLFDDFRDPNSGAVVLFSGEVRARTRGRRLVDWNMKLMNP